MLKVLNINSYYFSSRVHQQVKNRIPSNIQYDTFVALEKNKKQKNPVEHDDTIKVSYCFNKFDKIHFKNKNRKIYQALLREDLDEQFDLIHAHSLFTNGLVAYHYGKEKNIPYIVTVRSTDIVSFFRKMIHLRKTGVKVLLNAEKIILLSTKALEAIEQYIPKQYIDEIKSKVCIVPNGIDDYWLSNPYKPKQKPKEVVRLLHVGDVSKRKNILSTIKAVEYLNNTNDKQYVLNVIGRVRSEKILKKATTHDFVNYLGMMDKEELLKHYRQNDIFIMPSLKETFGLVYPEAMSQGMPVLYTKNEGFDGQFKEGEVGYSLTPKDAKDIANKIKLTLNNYETISENAYHNYTKFNWRLIAQDIVEIYQGVDKQ